LADVVRIARTRNTKSAATRVKEMKAVMHPRTPKE
jgi:hypothetical protein